MGDDGEWAIFLNGSYGVGKSSVLEHVGDLLAAARRPFSLMDVDWFHRSWPQAEFDDENTVVEARNMAAVWSNYRSTGPRRLVISGVIESPADLDRYTQALELRVRPVRLIAASEIVKERLRRRYSDSQGEALQWHLDRHAELDDRLSRADLDETLIDTDLRTPSEVATAVLDHFSLP